MNKQISFDGETPTLYLVATPIGNLKDLTYRAVEVLNQVDLILVEDSRVSKKLLSNYGINKPLISYHDFNKEIKNKEIINLLNEGKNLALITDAGTPCISDPGYELVADVKEKGFKVVALPGASAILTALMSSGLVPQPFSFLGFLPRKKSQQQTILTPFKMLNHTLVIFESPNRVTETLKNVYECLGERQVSLCRELTKKFETIIVGALSDLISLEHETRGEYVIIVELLKEYYHQLNDLTIIEHVKHYMKSGILEKEALKLVAKDRNITKSEVYKVFLQTK
jgi:16S rRNA (cytidine1402-2'-O)-methyltransferase